MQIDEFNRGREMRYEGGSEAVQWDPFRQERVGYGGRNFRMYKC